MKKFLFSIIILSFAVTIAQAQTPPAKNAHHAAAPPVASKAASTGPSMEEAVAFLRDTIGPDCSYGFSRCTHFSLTLEDGTTLRYRQEGKTDGDTQGFTESVIDLKQLDSTRITKTDLYIPVVSKGDAKAIVFSADNRAATAYPKQDFIVDSVDDLENARKTILYMIELSQGTPTEQSTQDFQQAKAESSAKKSSGESPRLFDTLDYIQSLLENHGCAAHRWHDHWTDSEGIHNENDQNQGCTRASEPLLYLCGMTFRVVHTGVFYEKEVRDKNSFGVSFSKLDPSSVRQSEADLAHEVFREQDNVDKQELVIGRMVNVLQTDGSSRGPFYMDTSENADHLINALTHAIQLCGGKKSAF